MNRQLLHGLFAFSVLIAGASGLAAGCGDDQSIVGGSCAAGFTQCGAHCVKLDSDSENCGVCGTSCPSGVACTRGECGGSGEASLQDAADAAADGTVTPNDAASLDVEPMDGPAQLNDGPTASGIDGSTTDGVASNDSTTDGTTTPSDGATSPNDGSANDGSANDGSANDGLSTDASPSDATMTDASANDDSATDVASPEAATSEGASDDATGEDASEEPLCTPPLADCSGVCIDTTMDPANCGACGTTCYSGICQSSHCVGETTGSLIFIGHDYTTYSQAQARVLANAVLLPQASQMVPVLSYERYAGTTPLANVKNIISTAAKNIGRTLALTSTTTDSDVTSGLTIDTYGVLLVVDQPNANSGDLAALGASWMSAVTAFTHAGGVVVVLDSDTGVQEMPALVTSTQLLNVTAQVNVPIFTQLTVAVPTDAIAQGVASPYAAGAYSASFTTEPADGSVVYVVTDPGPDGSPSAPVVIHKVF
jgi:hypothetical protein